MDKIIDKKWRFNYRKVSSKYSLIIILILLMGVCSFTNQNFLTVQNLINVIRQQSVIIIIALGEMMLIISGMLDLSAGAVVALSGVISVSFYKMTGNLAIAIAAAIFIAVFSNLLNGIMVTKFKAPPFIATLAMQTIARGAALLYTGGQNIYQIGDYAIVGQGSVGFIPIPVIIMITISLVMFYIMKHTKFGRSTYAVGGNEEAARASGINISWTKMKAFILHGCLVGISAVVFTSRINGGSPNGAQGYEFEALTATIIGGTSFSGGAGSVAGTVIGAFIVGFLNNIMNLLSVDSYIQQMIRGAIIAGAVIWDIYSRERQTYKKKRKMVSL